MHVYPASMLDLSRSEPKMRYAAFVELVVRRFYSVRSLKMLACGLCSTAGVYELLPSKISMYITSLIASRRVSLSFVSVGCRQCRTVGLFGVIVASQIIEVSLSVFQFRHIIM